MRASFRRLRRAVPGIRSLRAARNRSLGGHSSHSDVAFFFTFAGAVLFIKMRLSFHRTGYIAVWAATRGSSTARGGRGHQGVALVRVLDEAEAAAVVVAAAAGLRDDGGEVGHVGAVGGRVVLQPLDRGLLGTGLVHAVGIHVVRVAAVWLVLVARLVQSLVG